MRKFLLSILVLTGCQAVFGQADSTLLYLRFPTVPPFRIITMADSSVFTKADLSKKKATIIMVFSPDCEHCQEETKAITAKIDLFKKVQIVMASPLDYDYIKKFYQEYKIADYPNITMGRDPGYYLGTFYKVRSFPAIFLYDKKGNFIKAFNGSFPIEQLLELL